MKFLDVATFAAINAKLNHMDIGEAFVGGRIEAYSCKVAGTDKKLMKTLRSSLEKTANLEKNKLKWWKRRTQKFIREIRIAKEFRYIPVWPA